MQVNIEHHGDLDLHGSSVCPTQTMHCHGELRQNNHIFAVFDFLQNRQFNGLPGTAEDASENTGIILKDCKKLRSALAIGRWPIS